MPALIKLRLDEFERLCQEHGLATNPQRAEALRVDTSTISRVQTGAQRPGAAFIDGALALFGAAAYPRLFRREDEEEVETCAS